MIHGAMVPSVRVAGEKFYSEFDGRAMNSVSHEEKFQKGLEHFNTRKFFEAHEIWEEVWLEESAPEKTFLQGLIQIAAAFHHYQHGNPDGAESLLASGIVKLSRAPENHHGLGIGELRMAAKEWARALGAGKDPGQSAVPHIKKT